MSKVYKVIHKKSNVVNDGAPKLPQASTLEYGEIAINYGVSGETLSIKNSADQIVTFPSRDIIDRMVEGKGYLTGYTETDPTVPSWAKAESKPSYTASEVGAMATSERGNYLTTATTIPSIAGLVASVDYDSTGKTIVFYDSSDNVVDSIDATDFIKDGMVDSVAIATPTGGTNSGITCLVVTFNTDAGKEDIEIPLSNIFNPANYYNKTQADQTFLSQSAYTEDEEVVATALNDLNDRIENIHVPSYTSELNNDSGFITSAYTGFSSTGHTHSQYSTTAHTHTAAEVGAMATSERGNYLTTGATLDNVADGTTRKLSDYSTTGHTHSEYFPASGGVISDSSKVTDINAKGISLEDDGGHYTEINAEGIIYLEDSGGSRYVEISPNRITLHDNFGKEIKIGNWDNGNIRVQFDGTTYLDGRIESVSQYGGVSGSLYIPTGKTGYIAIVEDIPTTAAEVGAMATSERGNYLATGTTLDSIADGSTRKLSDYSTTGHSHTAAEVGAMATSERGNYLTTATTIPTTAAEVGAMATSERSNYLTTATTIPTTAAEVGAMATSERSNYLTTGTTLDNVADGSTRKLSDYSTTGHSHTAAEVGAMATSERSNYLTTATTIPTTAAEVGAMATSERSNYLTTATTIPTESTISSSGFTKNGITGINVNGTASTVTNGVADITIPSGLPAVTATDNGKILQVVNGAWTLVTPTTVYTGTDVPLSSVGNDGDIYLQTS